MSTPNAKIYTVYFFTIQAKNSAQDKIISTFDFFKNEYIEKKIDFSQPIELGANRFQLRNICLLKKNEIGGALTRLREDVPPIGSSAQSEEREIELEDDESFLEKSHFVISKESNGQELISFQYAIEAGTVNTLGKLLKQLIVDTDEIEILEIFRQDAMQRVMNGEIRYIEYVIAKPKKIEEYIAEDDFTKNALELMRNTNATRFYGKIGTGKKGGLQQWVKEKINGLLTQPETTKKLKVKLNEVEMPIDILGDQLKGRINVLIEKQQNRRPETSKILHEISSCKTSIDSTIKAVIGR